MSMLNNVNRSTVIEGQTSPIGRTMSEEKGKYNVMTPREKLDTRISGIITQNTTTKIVTINLIIQEKKLVGWVIKNTDRVEA